MSFLLLSIFVLNPFIAEDINEPAYLVLILGTLKRLLHRMILLSKSVFGGNVSS